VASAKLPTPDELKAVGRQLGMSLSDSDVEFFLDRKSVGKARQDPQGNTWRITAPFAGLLTVCAALDPVP